MSGGLFPTREPTGVWWRDHSLGITLSLMLVAQTLYTLYTARAMWVAEELPVSYLVYWSHEYNVSLVADTFGVWLIVYLTKWQREVGSAESS